MRLSWSRFKPVQRSLATPSTRAMPRAAGHDTVHFGGRLEAPRWLADVRKIFSRHHAERSALSPLMQAMYAAARAASNSTVDADMLLTYGNRPCGRLLLGGPAIYAEHYDSIIDAESEVLLQTMTWERWPDKPEGPPDKVMAALRKLQEKRQAMGATQPVRVVVMVDQASAGTQRLGHLAEDFRQRLGNDWKTRRTFVSSLLTREGRREFTRQALSDFRPEDWKGCAERDIASLGLDPRYVKVDVVGYRHKLLGVMHVKDLLVDGERAVITGANLQPNSDPSINWFDTGAVFEGPIVGALRSQFIEALQYCDVPLTLPESTPPAGFADGVPILLASRGSQDNPLLRSNDSSLARAYGALFKHAARRVRIITPNFNASISRSSVLGALERRVPVQLVLSKGFNEERENHPLQGGGNEAVLRGLRAEMRSRGIDASLLEVRWFSQDGKEPVVGNGIGASHCKYISADGQVAGIRTANDDTESLYHAREICAFVDSQEHTEAWDRQLFEPVWERAIPA